MKYSIITINYFTKWVEVEPLATITEKKTISFMENNIIYRFEIPYILIVDNERQFDNPKFKEICTDLSINLKFVTLFI